MIVLIVFIAVLETGQFHVVLAFYVSKTKFACMHILNNSAALLTFLVLNLNGMKTLMGFIRQHTGFCRTQQASKIRVRTKYFLIRCTRAGNLRGLGAPAGMLGSPKGSPKFSFGRPTLRSGRLN